MSLRCVSILFLFLLVNHQVSARSQPSTTSSNNTYHPQIPVDPKTHVTIVNFEDKLGRLTLRCQSEDDDLGIHYLEPHASWSFSFRPKFLVGGTLFYCNFGWAKDFKPKYVNIYEQARDMKTCDTDCVWHIKQKAPCLQIVPETCYPWKDHGL